MSLIHSELRSCSTDFPSISINSRRQVTLILAFSHFLSRANDDQTAAVSAYAPEDQPFTHGVMIEKLEQLSQLTALKRQILGPR